MLLPLACAPADPPPMYAPPPQPGVRVTLTDGAVITGEPLAAIDHHLWWRPSAGFTHLVFEVAGLAPYPHDGAIRVISARDVATLQPVPPALPTWRQTLRAAGLVIDRMPLDISGPALILRGNDGYHLAEGGYGTFAWDLALTDDTGARFAGDGSLGSHHYVWDAPVVLPLGGTVVEVVSDAPDHDPGSIPAGARNNLVGVRVAGHLAVYLLHLAQGSVPAGIQPGAVLPAGTLVGRVGMSGITLEPHLHVVLLYLDHDPAGPSGRVRSWSVPVAWGDMWVGSSPTGPASWSEEVIPQTGQWIAEDPF